MQNKMKVFPDFSLEEELIDKGYTPSGVDEVGRGVFCGPVVAAAVVVPKDKVHFFLNKVRDSKKLSLKKRFTYYNLIKEHCTYGICEIDNNYVDTYNILEATKTAMYEALHELAISDYALIDGNMVFDMSIPYKSIIKGDNKSVSIACASILAKVHRDLLMQELHYKYPMYGFDTNMGYGTKKHREAIVKYGITPYHRKTFKGVREYV